MSNARPRILFVTDFGYQARGRRYGEEDLFLTSQLRDSFVVATCHPADAVLLMDGYDLVVVRNTGPVIHYLPVYRAFREHAAATGAGVYNELTGRGDMAGKEYLTELFAAGYPVIPTISRKEDLVRLPTVDRYVVKPVLGADSVGLAFVDGSELADLDLAGLLVQPLVRFSYEVSFYFVDDRFQYALHAPDPDRRWVLEPYAPTPADLRFAQRFIDWNTITSGIQRVDACRTPGGELLLVELEDLNPYLSLDLLPEPTRAAFVQALVSALFTALGRAHDSG